MRSLSYGLLVIVATNMAFGANQLLVNLYTTTEKNGKNDQVGTIIIEETDYGLIFKPDLKNLTPGLHGFHIHEKPSCKNNGMAAGGHFDPKNSKKHLGPYQQGHLGDLPVLYVDKDKNCKTPVLAPRLKKLSEISERSLMVHEGGDTYADIPELGGGGKRMWCGTIMKVPTKTQGTTDQPQPVRLKPKE